MEHSNNQMFGSFFLGNSEFAIPAARIEQVVATPDQYLNVPQSPDYVRGTFDLRGTIITLIDLEILFGIPKSDTNSEQVAVLEFENQLLGVIFESTGEVFRGKNNEFSEFHEDTRNPFVEGVFKQNRGQRLVQAIDVKGLFTNTRVPRDKTPTHFKTQLRSSDRGPKTQYMTFSVGDTGCALPISEVQEVFAIDSIEQSVFTGDACLGLTQLRGGTLPIIDLAVLLNRRADSAKTSVKDRRVVVIQCGSDLVGFLVTAINDIVSVYQDEIVPFPAPSLVKTEMFLGSIVRDKSLDVIVFDHEALRSVEEVKETTRVHGKLALSPLKPLSSSNKKSTSSSWETFLIFSAGQSYAVRMNEIQEIIDLPEKLLQPPGLPDCFSGIVNLRGQVTVVIVDYRRSMFSDDSGEQQGKVIIFDSDGGKAGLIVDSVDSIFSVNTDEIVVLSRVNSETGDREVEESFRMTCPKVGEVSVSIVKMEELIAGSIGAELCYQ